MSANPYTRLALLPDPGRVTEHIVPPTWALELEQGAQAGTRLALEDPSRESWARERSVRFDRNGSSVPAQGVQRFWIVWDAGASPTTALELTAWHIAGAQYARALAEPVQIEEPVTVDGTVGVSNLANPHPVSGTVGVSNLANPHPVTPSLLYPRSARPFAFAQNQTPNAGALHWMPSSSTYYENLSSGLTAAQLEVPLGLFLCGWVTVHNPAAGASLDWSIYEDLSGGGTFSWAYGTRLTGVPSIPTTTEQSARFEYPAPLHRFRFRVSVGGSGTPTLSYCLWLAHR